MTNMTVAAEEAALKASVALFQRTKHAKELQEALKAGWLPQGVRLVDPAAPDGGRVLVFTPEEAKSLAGPLSAIVLARLEAASSKAAK